MKIMKMPILIKIFLCEILEFQGMLERASAWQKVQSITIWTLRGNKNKKEKHVKQDAKYRHEQYSNHCLNC